MLYGKYSFFCEFESDALLPAYKGSTFRGVFGIALKQVVCALKRETCSECLLKHQCVYSLVFENHEASNPSENSIVSSSPPAYVIEPPLNTKTQFRHGDAFDFNLLLFGKVNHNLPYFIYAFDRMGEIGIGRRVNGKRGSFILRKVKTMEHQIYSNTDKVLNASIEPDVLVPGNPCDYPKDNFQVRITIDTPLRFKFENLLARELGFHVLAKAMLRRISALISCHGDSNLYFNYSELIEKSKNIQTVKSDLKWFDWRRYSRRQSQSMNLGGLVGSITYQGRLGEFMPLIVFCSKVHLGKQTSFGLGKIRYTTQSS